METRSAIKVGITAVVGMALFGAAWFFFAHLNVGRYRVWVVFDDISGLLKQSPVRMNGVTVGEVSDIRLREGDLKPVVTLALDEKTKVPRESRIKISTGMFIANPQVEILPEAQPSGNFLADGDTWDETVVQKRPLTGLAALAPEANGALTKLTGTVDEIRPKLTQALEKLTAILDKTNATMANLQTASASGRDLIGNPRIKSTMNAMLADMQAVSSEARRTATGLAADLQVLVKRSGGRVDELTAGLVDLLSTFRDTVDAARTAATRLAEQVSDPRLQSSLVETLDLAKSTIARFNQIASDIHNLTGDANVQSDLKSTLSNLQSASEQGQKIASKLGSIVEKINIPKTGGNFGVGRPEFFVDALARSRKPGFRSDLTMRVPIGKENAFRLGIFDFAESNRLTAQMETALGGAAAVRYGLYGSKLGLGLDWKFNRNSSLLTDVFSPNSLQVDSRFLLGVKPGFSLWLGADDIFRRTTPLIGVRLSR
jgi:phospholipid/cholesterol/gamma-HCH transport system substrate-binding protein